MSYEMTQIKRQFGVCSRCKNLRIESHSYRGHVLMCGLVMDTMLDDGDVPFDAVEFQKLENEMRESVISKLESWRVPGECTMEPYATYRKLREL